MRVRAAGDGDDRPLVDALAALYAYVYGAPENEMRAAAAHRAQAMDYCDRWVDDGCELGSLLIDEVCAALLPSYAGLLAAVQRP